MRDKASLIQLLRRILKQTDQVRRFPRYESFEDASASTKGYEDQDIIQMVSRKTVQLRQALAKGGLEKSVSERQTIQNMFVLRHVFQGEPLSVIDVGGACGANFFILDHLLPGLIGKWNAVDTAGMALEGRRRFQSGRLHFFEDLAKALGPTADQRPNLVLASGVLQYLPNGAQALQSWTDTRADWIYLTRTVFGANCAKPVFTAQTTRISDHGPGPLESADHSGVACQPMVVNPLGAVRQILSRSYCCEYLLEEERDETTRIGACLVRTITAGFLYKRT